MQKNEENGHGNPRLDRKKRINNLSIKNNTLQFYPKIVASKIDVIYSSSFICNGRNHLTP
jgi:hypothetical protein